MFDTLIAPNGRILVIDDNAAIHADFRKILETVKPGDIEFGRAMAMLFHDPVQARSGPVFEVDSAFQGEQGLQKVKEAAACGRPYAMAFIDMRMPPGWDGMKTTLKLWEVCPDLQIVICTAYSDRAWEEMLESFGQTDRLLVLKKPFDHIEVLQLAHALTEKWRLREQADAKTEQLEGRVAERTRELRMAMEALQKEIAERAAIEEVLRQAQKMEAVGQLAAGVAHDFNNLLSVIRSYSGMLLDNANLDEGSLDVLREMDHAAERATNLTRQLLTFSRRQVIRPECLDLGDVVGQVGKLLHRVLGEDVSLDIQTAAALPRVFADRGMMEQILLNLVVNARDAMPAGGPVVIQSAAVRFSPEDAQRNPAIRAGHFACLSVADRGCGIAPEILPRLFEPFFTTKEAGKGTGLGLATVYGIVQQHEGWIEVDSAPERGTTFKVFLPESAKAAEAARMQAGPSKSMAGQETILLVEDEEDLRRATQLALQSYGYRVYPAKSGLDALRDWPTYAEEVDLLLTDIVMPGGVSGPELAKRLQAKKPGLRVIQTSGYQLRPADAAGALDEGRNFLCKPYSRTNLGAIVRECLDRSFQASDLAA